MKNIDVIRELVCSMEGLSPRNEALKLGVVAFLDRLQMPEPQPEPTPEPEPEPEKPKKAPAKRPGRKPFDIGKAKACLDAGWSVPKIADEMSVSEQTVRNHFNKAGIKYA